MPGERGLQKPQFGEPRIVIRPAPNEPMNLLDPPIEIEEEAQMMDGEDDPCCTAAKARLGELGYDNLLSMDCTRLHAFLSELDDNLRKPDKNALLQEYGFQHHSWVKEVPLILEEWTRCAESQHGGDFTASQDPMEAGWGHITKEEAPLHHPLHNTRYSAQMMDGEDDPCCAEAFEKVISRSSDEMKAILQSDFTDCTVFRQWLENLHNTTFGVRMGLEQVLDEWDECASQSFSGDVFTASQDPMETGWGHIAKLELPPIERDPSLRQRVEDILLPDEDTIPDVGQAEGFSNDPCCQAAYEKVQQGGATTEIILDVVNDHANPDCDILREYLEWGVSFYTSPDCGAYEGDYGCCQPRPDIVEACRNILQEWDACLEGTFSGDFTASNHPFDEGWGIVQKHIGSDDFRYQRHLKLTGVTIDGV